MSVTHQALFVIERNLAETLTLDDIALACGVSRFHLAHAFGRTTGWSVIDYLRQRRLSEAARRLADGAPDILGLALAAGYGSHEAFSRAFKAQFGLTPDQLRRGGDLSVLPLVDPLGLPPVAVAPPAPPIIRAEAALRVVGLGAILPFAALQGAAALWGRFMAGCHDAIPHRVAGPPVGVALDAGADGIDYLCAAAVSAFGPIPAGCRRLEIPAASYAVFAHDGPVAAIPATYRAIWEEGLPRSGRQASGGPCLERHNPGFDPRTGTGGLTIWIPLLD